MPSHLPSNGEQSYSRQFQQQLLEIRKKIETLPEPQRPYFRALADDAETHHRSMQSDCAAVRGLVDDMRLQEASVTFDLWAGARNIQGMFSARGD
jgi:hypothetical protein